MSRTPLRLLALALAVALAVSPGFADDVDDAAARGDAAEARAALERLLDGTPDEATTRRVRILAALAEVLARAGDFRGAVQRLESALALAPDDRALLLRQGELLLVVAKQNIQGGGLGRTVNPFLRDAVTALAKLPLASDDPLGATDRARAVYTLAEAHFLLGELAPALETLGHLDLAALPQPQAFGFHDLHARILYALERYEEAARAFVAARNPMAAASAFDAARMPEESIPLYAEAIRQAPASTYALDRALAAVRYHKAHAALQAALEDVPAPDGAAGIPLLLAKAELLEGAGRLAEALPLLRDAAARDPEDPTALVTLGRLLGLQALSGDAVDEDALDASAEAYTAAIRRAPEDEAAAGGLGWLASHDYARLWKSWRNERITDRCLRVQRVLVEAVPDDAWGWANLGNTLRVLGRAEESLAAYEKARAANPYEPGIISDHGLALSGAGRFDEALAAFEASVALDGGHLAGHQNAARALYERGRLDASADHLGAAARTARAIGGSAGTYRFLLDRVWRASRRPALR